MIRICRLNAIGGLELFDITNDLTGLHHAPGGYVEVFALPRPLATRA